MRRTIIKCTNITYVLIIFEIYYKREYQYDKLGYGISCGRIVWLHNASWKMHTVEPWIIVSSKIGVCRVVSDGRHYTNFLYHFINNLNYFSYFSEYEFLFCFPLKWYPLYWLCGYRHTIIYQCTTLYVRHISSFKVQIEILITFLKLWLFLTSPHEYVDYYYERTETKIWTLFKTKRYLPYRLFQFKKMVNFILIDKR